MQFDGLYPFFFNQILTKHSFDAVWNVQFSTGGQSSQEGCSVSGALETLSGLLETLTVVHLQVDDRTEGLAKGTTYDVERHRNQNKCKVCRRKNPLTL